MNEANLLRKAIREYVINPWMKKQAEYKQASENAAYNGEMIGPSPPDASTLMVELNSILAARPDVLRRRIEEDAQLKKTELESRRRSLKGELATIECALERLEKGD